MQADRVVTASTVARHEVLKELISCLSEELALNEVIKFSQNAHKYMQLLVKILNYDALNKISLRSR